MPDFEKPTFAYDYVVDVERDALRTYRDTKPGRAIPAKVDNRLLVASWNIANLGTQYRRPSDLILIAEILSWFDVIAIQEVKANYDHLEALVTALDGDYRVLSLGVAGNSERLAFIYDSAKAQLLEMVGEVAVPPKDVRYIKLPVTDQKFGGFDRSPYVAGFQAGDLRFVLGNAHLYYGSASKISENRRALEAYALARCADLERKRDHAFAEEIILVGDFNLPKVEPGDAVYDALTKRSLRLFEHSTKIGSAIATDEKYDQIAFFPSLTGADMTGACGVFDYDGAVFQNLWSRRSHRRKHADFIDYCKYYISDHRPVWVELVSIS